MAKIPGTVKRKLAKIPDTFVVGDLSASPRGECRVAERYPCELKTSCQPPGSLGAKGTQWPGTVHDVSVAGIGLVLQRRFEPGAGLAIDLPGTIEGETVTLLARVVHVKQQKDGSWQLGCAFVSVLSDEELAALRKVANSASDPSPDSQKQAAPEPEREPPTHQEEAHDEAVSEPVETTPTEEAQASDPVVPSQRNRVPEPPGFLEPDEVPEPAATLKTPTSAIVITDVLLRLTYPDGETVYRPLKRIRLRKAWPLPEGKVLTLMVGGESTPERIRMRVDMCSAQGGFWVIHGTVQKAEPVTKPSELRESIHS